MRRWLLWSVLALAACSSPRAGLDKVCRIAAQVEEDASIAPTAKAQRLTERIDKEVSSSEVRGTWHALANVSPADKPKILAGAAAEWGYPEFKCPVLEARLTQAEPLPPEPEARPRPGASKPPRGVVKVLRVEGGEAAARAQLSRTLADSEAGLSGCYQKRLAATDVFEGNLTLRALTGAAGGLIAFGVETDTLNDQPVRTCITELTKGWRVPAGPGGPGDLFFELEFRTAE